MSSSGGTPISYRPQVNRAITKRWAEAKQISYEGNDWGDDDDDFYEPTPSSARGSQQSGWPAQVASAQRHGAHPPQQGTMQANRSFTNPSPTRSNGRQSFDRGDERRNFSTHAPSSSFEGPYPTAQHSPFPEPQHDFQQAHQEPSIRAFPGPPPLHVQTQLRPQSRDHPQHTRLPSTQDTRGGPYQDPAGGISYGDGGRRSESSGRPSLSDLHGRSESPYRTINPTMSARNQHSRDGSPAKRFPPRQSSLSQETPILEPSLQPGLSASASSGAPASNKTADVKPLPFIRPADIYKRMEEEREKERRSQESSRPSIDSNTSRPRERDLFTSARQSQESSRPKIETASGAVQDNPSPARAPPTSSLNLEQLPDESKSIEALEDMETTRRLKSTLDPVAERKSEYGFENMLKEAGPDHPSVVSPTTSTAAERPTLLSASSTRSEQAEPLTAISASSKYSDRPDPVTTSSQSSKKSLPHLIPVSQGVLDFGPDFLDRSSTQRDNISPVQRSAAEAQNIQPKPSAASGAQSSSLQGGQDGVGTRAATSDHVDTEMRHNPSIGLRSVVHQGFDDSQDQAPQTPLSTDESVVRSSSASASDISPIISRATSSFPVGAGPHQSGSQHPSIAEAMEEASTTPLQSTPTKPHSLQVAAQEISEPALPPPPPPPPPLVRDGYRRDYSIPSTGNSQSRTPLTVGTVGIPVPEAERASKSNATPLDIRKPWAIPTAASEDFQDMESQIKPPRTKAEPKDLPLPPLPSTSPTVADPPSRGTIRELAEKLESRSGRVSPAVSLDPDQEMSRPLPARLESFRPSLPGGWQSYSTNADGPSHQQEQGTITRSVELAAGVTSTQHGRVEDSPVSSEDDDIPVAGPPRPRREDSDYGPSKSAFAAAAAAGSALVSVFSPATGLDSGHNENPHSHEVSEDESVTTDSAAREGVSRMNFGNITVKNQGGTLAPKWGGTPQIPSPTAPSPPAKDTPPSESDTPISTAGYFPPPLRPSRTAETIPPFTSNLSSTTRPPMLPGLSSDTTMQDTENDRLRRDIVRSLTPKSSQYEGDSTRPIDDDAPLPQTPVVNEAQLSNLDTAPIPEQDDSNTRKFTIDTDKSKLRLSQTPTAPITTDTVPPQSNTSAYDGRQLGTPQARTVADVEDRPILEQRFSWEAQSETVPSVPDQSTESISARSPRTPEGARGETGSPETIRPHAQPNTLPTTNSSRVALSMAPADTLRHVQDDGPSGPGEVGNSVDTLQQGVSIEPSSKLNLTSLLVTDSNSLLHVSAREVPFREILSLGTPQDRIQAFNTNRAVVASQDTGLDEWLKAMGNQLPEHSDTLRNNGRLSAQESDNLTSFKPSPARSKFRIASLANSNQSTDPEYDPSIANGPSGGRANNLYMPGQGKKLLKDAGKIGGQAGVVAKGLFTKGKNKLRAGAGSSDKGILAGRRRSSQPMIVIDEPQHSSSVTTNTAPQIPNLNLSPVESGEHWYKPIDAANSPVHERSVSPINAMSRQESNNRDLMLPGHVDRPVHQIKQSSPRVSAVGSLHDGELPSRSISEVTRPTNSGDERSPIATIPEDFMPSTATEKVAQEGPRQSRLLTAVPTLGAGVQPTRVPSAPVSDALGPLPILPRTANVVTNPAATESNVVEQDVSSAQVLTSKAHNQEPSALAPVSDALATIQYKRQPVESAVLSQGSSLPTEQSEAAALDANPPPRGEDVPQPGVLDSNSPNRTPQPPDDGATPPYTETRLSKEAEVAMYGSQVDPSGNPTDGLPAYKSNRESVQNVPKPRVGAGDTIIPVADLSHQRKNSCGLAQSRPFSFIAGDTLISRGHTPIERVATASDTPPIQPDLAKEISVASFEGDHESLDLAKRKSQSYTRPFVTDPSARDRTAYRQSQDMARNKEIFIPRDQSENSQPVANKPSSMGNDDEQYRIPGPYVQEYRSPKQPLQALAAKQLPPPQLTSHEQPTLQSAPGMNPLRSHDPRGENQMRPPGQPVNTDLVPSTGAVASPVTDRPRQHSKGGLFRTRSKSRSVRSRNEEPQNVENKNEKRGGFFRQRTKGDTASMRNQLGSPRGSSVDGISKQMSREGADYNAADGERADHVGDLRNSSSGNPLQNDARKKRFSGLGSLFGRSSGGMKTSTKLQGSQPVQRASTLSHVLLGKPDVRPQQNVAAPDSMYAQNHERHQKSPQPDQSGNSSQSQPGFKGLNVPMGGYYAPNQQQQTGSPTMPHDPDSISRGRLSGEQQMSPDRYPSRQNQGNYQAPYQPGSQWLGRQLPSQVSQPEDTRPPLQINTNTNPLGARASWNRQYATAPPGPAPQFPLPSQSSSHAPSQASYYINQRPMQESSYESRERARSPYDYGGPQGTNPSTASHVINLHKRSRSPRNGRRLSDDERIEKVNRNDPASQLGTFNNTAAPRSGGADSSEQAAPWRIGLPNSEDEENKRKSQATLLEREKEQEQGLQGEGKFGKENAASAVDRNERENENVDPRKSVEDWRRQEQAQAQVQEQAQHEPTIAEKVMGVQSARAPLPLQRSTTAGNAMARSTKMSPVELPGSKAPGDDSDDEIVMSSTAYPGQEWAPENWGYGGSWDD